MTLNHNFDFETIINENKMTGQKTITIPKSVAAKFITGETYRFKGERAL